MVVDCHEVRRVIGGLISKRFAGLYEIPCFLLRCVSHQVLVPLVHIFNDCLSSRTFPSDLEASRIISFHRKIW